MQYGSSFHAFPYRKKEELCGVSGWGELRQLMTPHRIGEPTTEFMCQK